MCSRITHMARHIHAYIDWDNVSSHGLLRTLERLKEYPNATPHLVIIGIEQPSLTMSTSVWSTIMDLSREQRAKMHFHQESKKNASDFMICYELGREIEQWKQDTHTHDVWIISGDTSFEVLPSFITQNMCASLQDRIAIETMNIHRPRYEDHNTVQSIPEHIVNTTPTTDTQEIDLLSEVYEPVYEHIPKSSFRKTPALETLLKEWGKKNIHFPIRQKKLLTKLKDIYGNTLHGRKELRRVLRDSKHEKSLMIVLGKFLKTHGFCVQDKKKIVSLPE